MRPGHRPGDARLIGTAPRRSTRSEPPMIEPGQTLVNAVTGEQLTFLRTAAQTDGEYVLVECVVAPEGAVASAHVHPIQEERFEIVSGELGLRRGRERLVATAGDVVVVEPG